MKISTIVMATNSLQKLIFQNLPVRTAWELTKLVDKCNPLLSFYSAQRVKIGDDENAIEELNSMEVEGFEGQFRIEIDLSSELILSAQDIKLLEPFVKFKDGDAV